MYPFLCPPRAAVDVATGRAPPPELAFARGTETIAPIVEEHGHWGLRVRAGGRNAACRVCRLPLALKRPRELVAFPCGHWCVCPLG